MSSTEILQLRLFDRRKSPVCPRQFCRQPGLKLYFHNFFPLFFCLLHQAWTGKSQLLSSFHILSRSKPGVLQHLSLIHISEPTRRTPISYAVFCLKKKKKETQKEL